MFRFTRTLLVSSLLFVLVMPASDIFAQDQDSDDPVIHVVQSGDNLFRIAQRYGVSMDRLVTANNITTMSTIYSGQELVIPGLSVPDNSPVVENPLVAGEPIAHVVQRGESLTRLAERYGTTLEQILQANNISNPNRIYPGQTLNIWASQSPVSEPTTQALPEPPQQRVTHVVQAGESLSSIAIRYGVDWPDLAQINGVTDPNTLYAGQELTVPAVNGEGGFVDMGIITNPSYAPTPTITQGKQIIVDLSDSKVYAYQDGVLVYEVLASTGLPATPTVTGHYAVYSRVRSQTMSGPGYSLPNVEWVLYFYQGYAIHGTYWHSNWGRPMSHGCVNLPNEDARWFYENFGEIGTPVLVQQ